MSNTAMNEEFYTVRSQSLNKAIVEAVNGHRHNPNSSHDIFNKAFCGNTEFSIAAIHSAKTDSIEKICEYFRTITGSVAEDYNKARFENHIVDGWGQIQSIQVFADFAVSSSSRRDKVGFLHGLNVVVPNNLSEKFESTQKMMEDIHKFLTTLFFAPPQPKPCVPRGTIHLLGEDRNGKLELLDIPEQKRVKFDEANYSEEVILAHKKVIKEIKSKKPSGKIAIYQGPPGTGKTFAIRNLVSEISNCNVILIPPSMVKEVGSPSLISLLINVASDNLPIIFVLEDADEVLRAREVGNQSAISTLLNLGDGILGSILDTRIIATTNLPLENFDEAVTRSGRLIALANFDKLWAVQAKEVVRKLEPKIEESAFEGTVFNRNQKIRLSDCYEFAGNHRNGLSQKNYQA
jgi:hypothetical protein